MILLWSDEEGCTKLPARLSVPTITNIVYEWLQSNPNIECLDWDADADDCDIGDEVGWRVYCEDWGHVGKYRYSICAVKPAHLWAGK